MSTEEEEDAFTPEGEPIDPPDVSFRNTITEKEATPSDRSSFDSANEPQSPGLPRSKRGSDASKGGASSPDARDPNGICQPTKYIYIPAPAPYCMPTPIPMCSPIQAYQQPCQAASANSCMYVVGTNPCWDIRKCCCPPTGVYCEADNGVANRSYAPKTGRPSITQYTGDRQMPASPGRRTIVNQAMRGSNVPQALDAAYHVNSNAYRPSDGGGTYRNEYQEKLYHSQAPGSIYQERIVHDSMAQTIDSQLPQSYYDERKSQFRRQGVAHHIIPSRPTFAESIQSTHANPFVNTSGRPEKAAGVQVDPRQLHDLISQQQLDTNPGMVLGIPGMASNFEFNVKGDHTKTRFLSDEEQQTLNTVYEGERLPDHDLRSGHHSDHGEHRKTILHSHSGHKHNTIGTSHKKSLSAKSSKSNLPPQTHEQSVSAKSSKSRLTPRSLSPPKSGSSGRMTPSKTHAAAQQTKGAYSKEQVVQTYGMAEVQVYDPMTGIVHYQKREQTTSTTDLMAFGNNQFVSQNGFSGYNNNAEFARWDMDLDANFRAPMGGNPYGRDMGMSFGMATQGPYRDTNQCRSRTSCCYDRHGQLCKVVRPTTPPSLLGSSCGNPDPMFPDDGPCDAQSLLIKQKLEHQRRTMVIEQELQEQRQLLCLQKELLNQRQMFLMHQEMQYRKQAAVLKKALNKARKDLVDCTRDARVRKPDPCENPCEEPRISPRNMGGCSYRLVRNTGQIGFPTSNCHHQRLGDNQCTSSFTQGVPEPSDGVHVIKTGNVHAQYFLQTQGVSLSKIPNKVRMQYKPKERSNSCNKSEASATKIAAKEASRESSTGHTNLV